MNLPLDADLVIWHPKERGARAISKKNMLHHALYSGGMVWDADNRGADSEKGSREFLKRGRGDVLTGKDVRGMVTGERNRSLPIDFHDFID